MVPETRRSNFRTSVEASAQLQKLLRTLSVCPITHPPRKIKSKQLYIEVDLGELRVTVRTSKSTLAHFYANPTLADAVHAARSYCSKYYPKVDKLEYLVQ